MKIIVMILMFLITLIINLFSQTDEGYIKSAYDAIQSKDYSTAEEFYTKAIDQQPKYAPSYYGRGLARTYLNDLGAAISDFTNAI